METPALGEGVAGTTVTEVEEVGAAGAAVAGVGRVCESVGGGSRSFREVILRWAREGVGGAMSTVDGCRLGVPTRRAGAGTRQLHASNVRNIAK